MSQIQAVPSMEKGPQRQQGPRILFKLLNPLMKFILNSPLHQGLSKHVMILSFTGRKTGKRYNTPVAYAWEGDHVIVVTYSPWRNNFKEPALDVRNTMSRIKRTLEDYPQPGPVEQAGLHITGLGYPRGRQKSLFRDVRAKEHLAEDIKQLELKLGNPQVYTVKEVEPWSRIPERRYALAPLNQ